MKTWKHDELQEDLATFLRSTRDRVIWTNMQLGPAGSPRPDVYSIPKTFTRFCPLAYEIKVSVADYRRDVTAGKWQSYLQFAGGVTFAAPAGLIGKSDLPPGCGLMVRGEEGWRTLKAPTLASMGNLPQAAWLKLVMDGIERESARAGVGRRQCLPEYKAEAAVKKRYGEKIGRALADMNAAESALRHLEMMAKDSAARIEAQGAKAREQQRIELARSEGEISNTRQALALALGLSADARLHEITVAARKAANRLDRDEEVQRLRRQLEAVQAALAKGLEPVPWLAREGA